MRAASARTMRAEPPRGGRFVADLGMDDGGLGWPRLGPDCPPHDRDQIEDRQLQDEHQEDDLDHGEPF
jgi:hypothetical protein